MTTLFLVFWSIGSKAHAGGPWINQYCDIETTQVRIIDQQGNVIDERVEEKVDAMMVQVISWKVME